jgi:very-short-patch-repair endonuclease
MPPVRRQISPHAAPLRRNATEVEKRFWTAVRNRQLGGFKFRRQMTVGPYIVDFACIEAMLVVELDGGQHDAAVDATRTAYLERLGYRVYRVWNHEMIENEGGVLEDVLTLLVDRVATKKKTLTQPSPVKTGEG